jgi:hypothetical protein
MQPDVRAVVVAARRGRADRLSCDQLADFQEGL